MFSSFSKYFSMTGWRIGWMLVPERLRRPVDVLTGNFTICPPVLAQRAASRPSTTRRTPSSTATSRGTPATGALLLEGCPRSGSPSLAPADGAFYVYADVGHLTDDSMALRPRPARRAPASPSRPGIDFDTEVGRRFIRLSFAGPRADVETGLERLSAYLA